MREDGCSVWSWLQDGLGHWSRVSLAAEGLATCGVDATVRGVNQPFVGTQHFDIGADSDEDTEGVDDSVGTQFLPPDQQGGP